MKISEISELKRIVIVGGGVGGLILASRLAKSKKAGQRILVTLIDKQWSHTWKPILHDIAAGILSSENEAVPFLGRAYDHQFVYCPGTLVAVDRSQQTIRVQTSHADDKSDQQFNVIEYDILVIAIGSITNDFSVPGVSDYCNYLDTVQQAERFRQEFIKRCFQYFSLSNDIDLEFNISIIGAGATGVELAASLAMSLERLSAQGIAGLGNCTRIHLIEAGDRILPGQDPTMAEHLSKTLEQMGIQLHFSTCIARAEKNALFTQDGKVLPSDIHIWCAGIKAPEILSTITGLEVNLRNQLKTNEFLQCTRDENIYAIGDCADVVGMNLAPRAQVAQQQAIYLASTILQRINEQFHHAFQFKERGMFVSLSDSDAAGVLATEKMGSFNVNGIWARRINDILYRKHQTEILGLGETAVQIGKDLLEKTVKTRRPYF